MPEARIVLFTRYPEPGRAKTRLIPAIGAERAAALHRRLTEMTLREVQASGLGFEVRVTGAPVDAFKGWLGGVRIIQQGEGDLGARLERAAAPYPVLFIGADAPGMTAAHLLAASAALAQAPAVIGPADDGGFWLLGLTQHVPGLFEAMAWGTDGVFAETVHRLRAVGAEPAVLPTLSDIDRPEDLPRWPDLMA